MLQVLGESHDASYITLSPQFHLDLNWFNVFLKQYNGVTFFDNPVDFQVYLDASLSGLGGVFGPLVYALPLGTEFQHLHITQLEMLNVVVHLKVSSDKKVKIFSDNLAVVELLKSGKTKDPFVATCARNISLITAIFNIEIIVVHVPGRNNHIADLLSRWIVIPNPEQKLRQYLPNFIWINTHIDLTQLNLCI